MVRQLLIDSIVRKEMNKKKNKFLVNFGLLMLVLFASLSSTAGGKGYSINGTVNLPENTLVVLNKITDEKLEIQDSAFVTKEGSFKFEGQAGEESHLYYITFETANPPGIPVVLENGAKVVLKVNKEDVYTFTATGGKYNASMQKLHDIYILSDKQMLEFNAEVAGINADTVTEEYRQATAQRYTDLINTRSAAIENFIKTEPASPATYFAVKYLFQTPVPKLILIGADRMKKAMPNTQYTLKLDALASQLGPTVEGALAPEINLPSPEGQELALSSLRGKVVMIDFWASWCGPCRKENPAVKQIYEKYKDKGFEIYAVSLDNNKDQWKAAIAKDGLTWKHVSDLGGWKSSAAQLYSVHSIPQTFLLDEEGRIIKAGLRSHDLEPMLDALLN